MPNEILRKNADAKAKVTPLKLSMFAFKMTPHKTIIMGYLLFAHPNITDLNARMAEIKNYIAMTCDTDDDVNIELTRGNKPFGNAERFDTHLIKIRCERDHVNIVSNAIIEIIQEGHLP